MKEGLFSARNLAVLLARPLWAIPAADGETRLRDRCVLVTGAGGSVGAPLVNRLLACGASRVIAVDNHEASLFALGRLAGADGRLDLRLGDVRRADKIRRVFAEVRPDVVFHLAAYKHVPFGEHEPDEPVSVNVLGTDEIARAAIDAGVAHVVYPSSDKAVNPPSVYGATKRLAEALCLAHASAQSGTSFHICRYVNIVGSRGSVLETFERLARAGSPLTLTDPRMTRYWMTMGEAIDLLWHALSLESGSLTLLDTGQPIPVEVIARRLYQLVSGENAEPQWRITGSRAGERLAEELVSASETLVPCGAGPVLRIVPTEPVVSTQTQEAAGALHEMLRELRSLLTSGAPDDLRREIMRMAQLFQ